VDQIMKRITLKISKEFVQQIGFKALFRYVEHVELQRIYKFDENTMIAIQKFKFFDKGFTPEMLKGIEGTGIKYIQELVKLDDRTYVCLVKTEREDKFHEILTDFNLLLDYPLIITQDHIEISLIGDEVLLKQLTTYLSEKDFEILRIAEITPETKAIKALLTSNQIKIIQYAVDHGFFEIPRRIKSVDIAQQFQITVSAFNEMLRRVERKMFHTFFNYNQ